MAIARRMLPYVGRSNQRICSALQTWQPKLRGCDVEWVHPSQHEFGHVNEHATFTLVERLSGACMWVYAQQIKHQLSRSIHGSGTSPTLGELLADMPEANSL
jgi:hypothetical protein